MRLVLIDYLRGLRERKELEEVISNLLRAMHWTVLADPQQGVRQAGVDLVAVGNDPEDGVRRLFLVVIKSGDIDRHSWQGSVQAIRPSLEEIFDSFLPERVPSEHQGLPVKILLVTGGCLKQEVFGDWSGFTNKHCRPQRQFSFWGGDVLVGLVEEHLLNERLFPEACRSAFRKLLALSGTCNSVSPHFVALVNVLLHERKSVAEGIRGLRSLNLSLSILLRWCEQLDNLNEAWLCSERAVLVSWEWGRAHNLHKKKTFRTEFLRLYGTYVTSCAKYVNKIGKYCLVPDGLSRDFRGSAIEYHLWTQEVLGRLALYGLVVLGHIQGEAYASKAAPLQNVARLVCHLLANHPIARSPAYDDQVIEVVMALIVLLAAPDTQAYAKEWLHEMIGRVRIAYNVLGCHYPVDTESFDELLDMVYGDRANKNEHTKASSLFPALAEFCLIYGQKMAYEELRTMIREVFPHSCLQMWFPDESTDDKLYVGDAGHGTGVSYYDVKLPDELDDLSALIERTTAHVWDSKKLSCFEEGMPILAWISARHYRTPPIPILWRGLLPVRSEGVDKSSVAQEG